MRCWAASTCLLRKPTPAYISGATPGWALLKKDVRDTLNAAKNCSLEFCFRDIYTIDGDRPPVLAMMGAVDARADRG